MKYTRFSWTLQQQRLGQLMLTVPVCLHRWGKYHLWLRIVFHYSCKSQCPLSMKYSVGRVSDRRDNNAERSNGPLLSDRTRRKRGHFGLVPVTSTQCNQRTIQRLWLNRFWWDATWTAWWTEVVSGLLGYASPWPLTHRFKSLKHQNHPSITSIIAWPWSIIIHGHYSTFFNHHKPSGPIINKPLVIQLSSNYLLSINYPSQQSDYEFNSWNNH